MVRSWLLAKNPPQGKVRGELALWWAVVRRAAHDLRYSHRSEALDALEFLRSTGAWLTTALFLVDENEYQSEVVRLLLNRASMKGENTCLLLQSLGSQ